MKWLSSLAYMPTVINLAHFTLCEEHRVDFDTSSVSQPVRQLGEVEALKIEANFKILTIALHLVRYGHVCRKREDIASSSISLSQNVATVMKLI